MMPFIHLKEVASTHKFLDTDNDTHTHTHTHTHNKKTFIFASFRFNSRTEIYLLKFREKKKIKRLKMLQNVK